MNNQRPFPNLDNFFHDLRNESFPNFNVNSAQVNYPNEPYLNPNCGRKSFEQSNDSSREAKLLSKFQQLPRWNARFSGDTSDGKSQTLNEYIYRFDTKFHENHERDIE